MLLNFWFPHIVFTSQQGCFWFDFCGTGLFSSFPALQEASQVVVNEVKTVDDACYLELKVPSRTRLQENFWNFLEKYGFHYGDGYCRPLLPSEVRRFEFSLSNNINVLFILCHLKLIECNGFLVAWIIWTIITILKTGPVHHFDWLNGTGQLSSRLAAKSKIKSTWSKPVNWFTWTGSVWGFWIFKTFKIFWQVFGFLFFSIFEFSM